MHFVYIVKRPLTDRDVKRFGIDHFLKSGTRITVLDLSLVIHPDLPADYTQQTGRSEVDIFTPKTWVEFEGYETLMNACDLVFLFIQSYGLSGPTFRPLRMLSRCRAPYALMGQVLYPGWNLNVTEIRSMQRIMDIVERFRRLDVFNSIVSRLPPALCGIKPARFSIHLCEEGRGPNKLIDDKTIPIFTHTPDYEQVHELRHQTPHTQQQAVFLDQYMPYHADYDEVGAAPLDATPYFAGLRAVFDRIEAELGLKVIIAAHPRANYESHPGIYGDREIVAGKSCELVASSRLTIAHYSTAIGFAVAMKKPIMLLTSRPIYYRQVYEKYFYEQLSKELNTPLHFFDDPTSIDLSGALVVDDIAYDAFIRRYMRCAQAPDRAIWETVESVLMTDLSHR